MDLENRYKAQDGMKCNILQLIKLEPEWAADIIQYYEKQLAILKASQPDVEADAKCSVDFHKEEYLNGSTFCRVCGARIRTA
jgi:hypothetical protein